MPFNSLTDYAIICCKKVKLKSNCILIKAKICRNNICFTFLGGHFLLYVSRKQMSFLQFSNRAEAVGKR